MKPKVVTICGSTRFKEYFVKANLEETLAGNIVLTIGCDMKTDEEIFGDLSSKTLRKVKAKLDILHLHKILMSDEILVLNINGYIGESTEREICWAESLGIPVRYKEY